MVIACTIGTIFVGYYHKLQWINYDNNEENVYYYPKSYLRGSVYYLGAIFCYVTMPSGKKRKPRPEPAVELTEGEKLAAEAKKMRRRKKKKSFFAKINLGVGVSGFVFFMANCCLMHY